MESYVPALYGTAASIIPPLVAIVLALILKEAIFSLFCGIVVGALLYAGGNPGIAFQTMLFSEEGGVVASLTDTSHICIIIFVVLLWVVVGALNKSGSANAFGIWAEKHIKTRVGAQIATFIMGLLIFVDDGFNSVTVGSVMRPITDRYRVSRAKLAYLLDSTAAPICVIAPVSCWAAAVSYSVPAEYEINGFDMFIRAIPYNLYALGTLVMIIFVVTRKLDYGPMRRHEINAIGGDLFTSGNPPYNEYGEDGDKKKDAKISNLLLPIIVLIVSCVGGMLYTGGFFEGASVRDALANADSAAGLAMGGMIAVFFTLIFYLLRKALSFKDFMSCIPGAIRSIAEPLLILVLAWTLSGITGLLGTGTFVHDAVNSVASGLQMFLPVIIFVISVLLAFSTGTSWGTFTILIPIVCAVFRGWDQMLVISISACLSGAVCGDHCSPISDTTILSSAGAQSDHINHTTTQLPYAITVAAVSAVGYLLMGILGYTCNSAAALIATPVTLVLLVLVLIFIRKKTGPTPGA